VSVVVDRKIGVIFLSIIKLGQVKAKQRQISFDILLCKNLNDIIKSMERPSNLLNHE